MIRAATSRTAQAAAWMLFSLAVVLGTNSKVWAADAYTFTYRSLQNGDVTVQQVNLDLNLQISVEQAGQTIDSTKHLVNRKQLCRMTVLETGVVDGAPVKTKIRLTYDSADQSQSQNDEPLQEAQLPVAGKTYFASWENGKLLITDEQGNRPSDEEWAIVATATESLGKPNPIAKFFHGQTYQVGQELRMPPALAKDLLGFSGRLDNATLLVLTFAQAVNVNGKRCAVFDTNLDTKMTQGNTMNMQMRGRLVLEIDTCRAIQIDLAGPVKMAEAHGPADGQFSVNTAGNMKMALRANYTQQR